MKDTSATVLGLIPRAEPVRVEGRQRRLQGVIQKFRKERGVIKESYICLRGALHDGQEGLRCNHILRHFSW